MITISIISKYGILKWNNANRKRYENLGYIFTKNGEEFTVKIEDLTPTTRANIHWKCDYCGEVKESTFKDYNQKLSKSIAKKDACENKYCRNKKIEESSIIKYGTSSPNQSEIVKLNKEVSIKSKYGEKYSNTFQLPEVREKVAASNLNRYGVENVFQSEEIKERIRQFNQEHYGVDSYTQTTEFIEKSKKTNLIKYGVEFACQSDEVKKKIVKTNMERYGVPVALQNKDILQKVIQTNIKRYGVPYYTQTEEYKKNNSRENNYNWQGGKSKINSWARNQITNWVTSSEKVCDYKCVLTGSSEYEVHHLYSFNKIFDEAIKLAKLKVKDCYSDYSIEELDLMKGILLDLHYKYGLGICLHPSLHLLYHNIYRFDNTPEQFKEFSDNYRNGLLEIKPQY